MKPAKYHAHREQPDDDIIQHQHHTVGNDDCLAARFTTDARVQADGQETRQLQQLERYAQTGLRSVELHIIPAISSSRPKMNGR